MKIQNDGIAGKSVHQSGKKGKVSSTGSSGSTSSSAPTDSEDKVSLSGANRLEELKSQIENLPVVDTQLVSAIQHQLGTGTYEGDDENAATNLIEIEKGLAEEG
jgi:flagellar biosynthesis anti-sigma factor FlgM